MATAIGLSMQLSASTSGLTSGLTDAEKLINKLGRGAESAAKYFDTFRDSTTGDLPAAMQQIVTEAGLLAEAFRSGSIDSEAFAAGISNISSQASSITDIFKEGVSVTAQYVTEEEKRAATIARLGELITAGAINEETYARAMADATGEKAEAALAEQELSRAREAAAQITTSVLTAQEKYDTEVLKLTEHLDQGRITQETYDRAVEKAAKSMQQAEDATKKAGDRAADAGLKFNELSGFFSLLPGPIGSAAGRISGFASTLSGIDKVIKNPTDALSTLSNGFALLTSPLGLAAAGLAAFGAAAAAVVSGLNAMSDRVEKLGQQADKLGASFDFVQTLEEAAKRAGSSLEAVGVSFKTFLTKLDEAKNGSGKTAEAVTAAFDRIGISSDDLKSKTPQEIYKQLAASLSNIEDPATRAAVATDLLGRAGLQLLPTFKGIADTEKDMARYFATLSAFDKIRFEGFDASVEAAQTATDGLGKALLRPFVGLGDGIARGTAEFIGGITAIVKPIGQVLEPVLTQIGRVIELFLNGVGAIGRTIGAILAPFGEVFEAISQSISPAIDAFYGLLQSVQGAGEAAAKFLVDFSLIGIIAENIDAITAAMQPFVEAFISGIGTVIEYAERIATIVVAAFQKFYEAVVSFIGGAVNIVGETIASFLEFTGLGDIVSGAFDSIGSAFTGLYESIKGIISGIGGFIESVVSFAENWLGIARDVETPVEAKIELDTTEPARAAEQFYDEITKAVDKTKDLGTEGFDAAIKYQTALQGIADAAAEGAYTTEEQKRAVALATAEFDKSVKAIEVSQKAREKAAEEAQKAADKQIEADRKVADQLIENQRIETEFGGSKERAQAAESLLAIENEIARVQSEAAKANASGDRTAADAAAARLAALDQAQAGLKETVEFGFNQQDIDEAVNKVREGIESEVTNADIVLDPTGAKKFFEEIQRLEGLLDLKIIDPKTFDEATKAAKKTFDESKKQAEQVRDLQIKYAEEAAKIQEERLNALSKASTEKLEANDVRTSEGASTVLRLATGRQDPAIEEYQKQFKKLEEIRKEIAKAQQKPVEIL